MPSAREAMPKTEFAGCCIDMLSANTRHRQNGDRHTRVGVPEPGMPAPLVVRLS